VKQLSSAAVRFGSQVEILSLDSPGKFDASDFDCPVHCIGPAYLNYGFAPKLAGWLRRNVSRYDAVIVNGVWQYHGFATWRMLRNNPAIPYFVFTHGMLDPWFRRRYPLKHLKKLLYWPWAEYRVLRDACAVLFTCEEERLLARQSFTRYRVHEAVVNYGTRRPTGDPASQRELFLRKFPQLRGKRLLLFLGRIHPKKGCDLLVEAFAAVVNSDPSLHLVIAGPDQVGLKRSLVERAELLGVASAISWTGMLSGDIKTGALLAAEAFLLPSHQENFGIAVAEALACGLPVLISNKVNIWREIAGDRAGLVNDDTLPGTVQLLQQWLALTVAERAAMAERARDCFARRFEIEAAAHSLVGVMERAPEERRTKAVA
jgi:glycosyltransferase involved in cell wall biosynthesis